MDSPYEVLRVDPDADEEAIERAYRERVKETHPDLGGSRRAFLRVRAAYEALTSGDRHDAAPEPDGERVWPDASASADRAPWDGDGRDESEPIGSEQPPTATVEYLDYEVLEDHGWGLDDEDLFEKASAEGLDPADYGRISVPADVPLLDSVERCGFTWPYACRGGACANCAVAVTEGELSMPADHILPSSMTDRGFRLSCIGTPMTDQLSVVYNVKHRPDLDELRLPPHRFERANPGD